MSYWWTFWIAVDQFFAAILFNRGDYTISAMAGLVLHDRAEPLRLWGWQKWFLKWVGKGLNACIPNHTDNAIVADIVRASNALRVLQ